MTDINLTDKYRTRSGLSVTILKTDMRSDDKHTMNPIIAVIHYDGYDDSFGYNKDGTYNPPGQHDLDLIKITPYDHLKIDDKVLVWNDNQGKHKRHFAGINEHGKPCTFYGGATSWTSSYREAWDNCEKLITND